MESEGRSEPSRDDERRRYYRLTDFGRRVALAEVERLEGLVSAGRSKALPRAGGPPGPVLTARSLNSQGCACGSV